MLHDNQFSSPPPDPRPSKKMGRKRKPMYHDYVIKYSSNGKNSKYCYAYNSRGMFSYFKMLMHTKNVPCRKYESFFFFFSNRNNYIQICEIF